MFRFVVCVTLFASGAAISAPIPKGLGPPPILVVLKPDKHSRIFLCDAEGKNPKALTEETSNASYPAWSPDGTKIAFSSDRTGVMNVYVMDADGSNVKALTAGKLASRVPAWSPDGKSLLFCRAARVGQEICSVPAAGGEVKVIDCGGDGWDPAWSPDGKKIAFVSFRAGNGYRLYVMDADGGNVTKLTENANPIGLAYPEWSPDGKNIAFADLKEGSIHIFTVNPDGKNLKQVTTETAGNSTRTGRPTARKSSSSIPSRSRSATSPR